MGQSDKCDWRASCGVTHNTTVNMEQARDQVDQVTNIMRGNVDKIMEREGKPQDLENKAEQLQADSQQFQKTVIKVKRKAWLENMKMKLAAGGAVCFLLLLITLIILYII